MKTSKTYLLSTAGALLFAARAAYGDIANGTYIFTAPGTAPVWDVSGEYTGTLSPVDLDFTITQNSDGTLTGSGTFDLSGITGNVTITGKVSGSSAKTGVAMAMVFSGSGIVNAQNIDFAANAKTLFAVDGTTSQLVLSSGSASLTETIIATGKKKSGSGKFTKGDTLNLPGSDTGGWNLTLNVTPNGTALTGTATIQTAPGESATFTATGTYSAKTDSSKITLKGTGGALSLVVSTSGSTMTVQSIKGKVFGQSVKFTNP